MTTSDDTTTGSRSLAQALTLEDGRATLDRSWFSWSGPQGGLVCALCLRAAEPLLGEGRVARSLTVLLLERAPEGSLGFVAEPLRVGGSSAVVAVEAEGVARATLVGGSSRGVSTLSAVPAPDVPGPDECPDLPLPVDFVPFSQHLRFRAATDVRPLAGDTRAELVVWARFVVDTPLDAAALTVLVDALPPALYGATALPVAVPTVELTVSFTEAPEAEGWVLLRIVTREAAGGWCVDDSEVWDRDGRLLAQARQTRRVLGEWQ
ncbi:acyl-CoA thioesterase [Nocardioides alkalitolerans]|uniref:acyl-CoA thioesterase n=1 Tax=Nocardioides alkalitolerans TaxID=281714 RepID=UPI0004294054|nr:thioesterase family protein [Nocardioides alkalitolerans]